MAVASILERVDSTLDAYEASFGPETPVDSLYDDDLHAEVSSLVEEAWAQEIDILPTTVDEHDLAVNGLTVQLLPPVARFTGMPLSALIGQRSL